MSSNLVFIFFNVWKKKHYAKCSLITIFVTELGQSKELIILSKKKINGDIKTIITIIESENINIWFNQIITQHIQFKAKHLIK